MRAVLSFSQFVAISRLPSKINHSGKMANHSAIMDFLSNKFLNDNWDDKMDWGIKGSHSHS